MNIATSLNRRYINYTIVMLTSLCENNPVHIDAYLLHSELTEEDIRYMESSLIKYDIQLLPLFINQEIFHERFPRTEKWSLEAYYRLLLLDLLPKYVERILYLDVDLIINKSLEEYYSVDFQTDEIITCVDICGKLGWEKRSEKQREMFAAMIEADYQYFNSGVMLFNVSRMRKNYNFDVYLRAIEEWNFEMTAPDQDILNYVHWQSIGYVDPYEYDLFAMVAHEQKMSYETVKEKAYIIHFSGNKPWNTRYYHFDIEKLWWDYAALTPCYQMLVSDFMNDIFGNNTFEMHNKNIIATYQSVVSEQERLIDKMLSMLKSQK